MSTRLILASQSVSRRRMLEAAGIPHQALRSPCDEEAAKAALKAKGVAGADLALGLAEAKARAVMVGEAPLILGCDQILVTQGGGQLDKAGSLAELADQLRGLCGTTHRLISAAVIVRDRETLWSAAETATLTMRPLSDAFISDYLACEGEDLLGCVGGYRIEGLGAQLFSAVEGNSFVVQGLPMFPLLDYLRAQGVIAA